jgi:hypothetical protein
MKSAIAKTIGLAAIIASSILYTGCRQNRISSSSEVTKTDSDMVTLMCKPIAVANAYGHGYGTVAVTYENEGKTEVAISYEPNTYPTTDEVATATALIQQEISDNDQDAIKLHGKYNGKVFEFSVLDVEGYHIKL